MTPVAANKSSALCVALIVVESTHGCSHYAVDPWLRLVYWIVFWDFVEARVAVCIVDAFFVIDEVLVVVLSRVVTLFAVVWFNVGGDVDARCMRSCATFTCLSLCLFDHPHPSVRCLELHLQSVVMECL